VTSINIADIFLVITLLSLLASFVIVSVYYLYKRKFLRQLREYSTYQSRISPLDSEIEFQYSVKNDENLQNLRRTYNLDQIAGKGSETDQIINLMMWVHNLAFHTPNPKVPDNMNSLSLIHLCRTENKKLSCWMFATILNDVYLSLGFKSRMIHLKPPKKYPRESHIVNIVYSKELKKWLFMDADFGAYFTDENKNILSLEEIREHFIHNTPRFNNSDMSLRVQNIFFSRIANFLGKITYQTYISKNIFRFSCPQNSKFGYEFLDIQKTYVELIPCNFDDELLKKPFITKAKNRILYTSNSSIYWNEPTG
jgi:hypothetical protein